MDSLLPVSFSAGPVNGVSAFSPLSETVGQAVESAVKDAVEQVTQQQHRGNLNLVWSYLRYPDIFL